MTLPVIYLAVENGLYCWYCISICTQNICILSNTNRFRHSQIIIRVQQLYKQAFSHAFVVQFFKFILSITSSSTTTLVQLLLTTVQLTIELHNYNFKRPPNPIYLVSHETCDGFLIQRYKISHIRNIFVMLHLSCKMNIIRMRMIIQIDNASAI